MKYPSGLVMRLCALAAFVALTSNSYAYSTWSTSGGADNCAACHGSFTASPYISLRDGVSWGNDLHDVHRNDMLAGDCDTCHTTGGRIPVLLNSSDGGTGLEPLSCVGCHGRLEPAASRVRGSGLRQHHFNSGVTLCEGCHADADPAAFTLATENVAPPYYFTPDAAHPGKPTDPCSPGGEENFAGSASGLDNDGDGLYDQNDPDCQVAVPDINLNPAAIDFGVVAIGASSTLATQIENLGTATLTVSLIDRCLGTSAEFDWSPLASMTVAPGGSESLTVSYMPTDASTDTGCLAISSDDPDEPLVELGLAGSGTNVAVPDISLLPPALDFGVLATGADATLSAQIQNTGSAALTVSSITLASGTSAEFTLVSPPATPLVIPPGGNETVSVRYAPVDVGMDSGAVIIASDDPDQATVQLALSGSGAETAVPDINLDPAALDFGMVNIGATEQRTTTVENLGTAALTVSLIDRCAGTSSEFAWTPDAPFTIAAGETEVLTVSYTPLDVGVDAGCLAIASNDPDESNVELDVAGNGQMARPVKQVNIEAPGAINPGNNGVTPLKFYVGDMDLEIDTVRCGPDNAAPRRLNEEDINDDGFMDVVGLFGTGDLGIRCGDTSLSCAGMLEGGMEFEGTSSTFRIAGRGCRSGDAEERETRGRRLYEQHCQGCHEGGRGHSGSVKDQDRDEIRAAIRGETSMQNLEQVLTEDDVTDIAAFLANSDSDSGSAAADSGGSGGGCTVSRTARFDPVLLALLLLAAAYVWCRRPLSGCRVRNR